LRRVLGEAPDGETWIETLPGRGYRFIGPVLTEAETAVVSLPPRVDAAPDPAPRPHESGERRQVTAKAGHGKAVLVASTGQPEPAAPGAAIAIVETVPDAVRLSPLPDKPSIAVLPFQNMSGDPEQEYFVDGTVEEIITALSRIRWLFVLARNSSFTYKGQAVDVKQVGRELGVHYVLEGSVRKAGAQVRITGQLIDAITGAHLWADRFRWLARRRIRSAGQGGVECRRRHRAGTTGRRNGSLHQPPDKRPDRLRSLSARLCDDLVVEAIR
jgi:TolB-like protein